MFRHWCPMAKSLLCWFTDPRQHGKEWPLDNGLFPIRLRLAGVARIARNVLSTMLIGRTGEWLLTRSEEVDGRHQAGDVIASPISDRRSLQDRMQGVFGPVFPASASLGLATALGCGIERVKPGLLSN